MAPLRPLSTSELFARYVFTETIGQGHFGKVWRCVNRMTGAAFACKQVRKAGLTSTDLADLQREIAAMQLLQGHRHVLQLRGLFEDDKSVYLLTDLCTGGDLFDLIAESGGFDERTAARIFAQIAQGVRWCHAHRVVHRDLKPENVLLTKPASTAAAPATDDLEVRLADFGLAFQLAPGTAIVGVAGSAPYEAPEVLARQPYDFSADIWSLGVLLYSMLAAGWPSFPDNKRELRPAVDFADAPWKSVSRDVKDLIRRMMAQDQFERLDIHAVLQHPWLKAHAAAPAKKIPAGKTALPARLTALMRDAPVTTADAATTSASQKSPRRTLCSFDSDKSNESLSDALESALPALLRETQDGGAVAGRDRESRLGCAQGSSRESSREGICLVDSSSSYTSTCDSSRQEEGEGTLRSSTGVAAAAATAAATAAGPKSPTCAGNLTRLPPMD